MISFVVIGKNESWRLQKCLAAICYLAESELTQPYEIIYVDSQSTDGSADLAGQFAHKLCLVTGECSAAIGRNIGAKEAQGDILFFLDGDMELREGVLASLFGGRRHLKYPFIAGIENDVLFDADWVRYEERPRTNFKEGDEWYDSKPETGMFVIERNLWENLGGMDCRFVVSEDHDFGFRASSKGVSVLRIGRLWVNHYTRYYAVRSNFVRFHKYSALLARKHFFNPYAQKLLLSRFYSAWVLLVVVFLSLILGYPYLVAAYLILLIYRTIRVLQRTSAKVNWQKILVDRFKKDCFFIYAFFFFHPSMPELKYKRLK